MRLNATYKGLITAAVMIVGNLFFFYILKKEVNSSYQFITLIVFLLGIVWSVLSFSSSEKADERLSNYFSAGFKTFIVVALMMVVYTFVFYKFNPQIRDAWIAQNNQQLQQQHNHTAQEIVANGEQLKNIFIPMNLAIITFFYLLLGSIITLLSSVIILQTKKK